jgi:hypothetical protein
MRLPPDFLKRFIRRGDGGHHKLFALGFFVVGLGLLAFGFDMVALICLVGFVHETARMDIAALRREIRAKRAWDDGQ